MICRRLVLALPLLAVPARAQAGDGLAEAMVLCWQARGVRFSADQVRQRIGARTGKAALLALAGAVDDADGDGQETAVEIAWEAGSPPSPAEPLLLRDLAGGLPALLLARDGSWWLLLAWRGDRLDLRHPIGGEARVIAIDTAALIGRPVIAGA